MRTLCEACCYPGLVEFQGAFYMPDSGQISIALEYMDGGSLADVIKVKKSIPEPVLAHMLQKVLFVCIFHIYFSFYASISKNQAASVNVDLEHSSVYDSEGSAILA
jgi:serine/threonine protein kinase